MLKKFFGSYAGYAILVIRLALGVIFVAHGGQKLFGLWGGPGLQGFAGYLGSIGVQPALPLAFLSAAGEFFGGAAVLLGVLARWGAFILIVDMIVAVATVHWAHGFFIMNQGYEYNVALIGMSLAILFNGSGKCSFKQD